MVASFQDRDWIPYPNDSLYETISVVQPNIEDFPLGVLPSSAGTTCIPIAKVSEYSLISRNRHIHTHTSAELVSRINASILSHCMVWLQRMPITRFLIHIRHLASDSAAS